MLKIYQYIDFHNTEFLVIGVSLLILTASSFVMVWMLNKRKFHRLKHQIPAGVVQNYLDSIIQNSSALKSSLFRGDIGSSGNPSVLPLQNLVGGSADYGSLGNEELNQKNAEISLLKSQMQERSALVKDLEDRISETVSELRGAEDKIEQLMSQLNNSSSSTPSNQSMNSQTDNVANHEMMTQLEEITKERNLLKERLQEYEIIEDDLANLKRLQQENSQLKQSVKDLEAMLNSAPEQKTNEQESNVENNVLNLADKRKEIVAEDKKEDKKNNAADTPEDLLSEFEKMLG